MTEQTPIDDQSSTFPTTAWTHIRKAQDPGSADYAESWDRFIRRYWKPVFYFLRAKGHRLADAEELTQGFFMRFLERAWLKRADPQRGRFRNYLLTILKRYLSDQGPKRAPRQQAFEMQFVSIHALLADQDRRYEPSARDDPDDIFMKQWAGIVVQSARERLKHVCEQKGRADWRHIFEAYQSGNVSQQALGVEFGMTRDQVRYAVEQVEKWFMILLRAEIRDELENDADVGEEAAELLREAKSAS